MNERERASEEQFNRLLATAKQPAEAAELVVQGIRDRRFHILISDNRNAAIRRRAEEILAGDPPTPPFP